MNKTRRTALPTFDVGLPPAPGPHRRAPYYFRVYGIIGDNRPFDSAKYKAEYFSGKVFAVSDDGEIIGYPANPVGKWRDEIPVNVRGGKRRLRRNRKTKRRN